MTESIEIVKLEQDQLAIASSYECAALDIIISSNQDLDRATVLISEGKKAIDRIDKEFEEVHRRTLTAHRAVLDMVKRLKDRIKRPLLALESKVSTYVMTKKRQEEEERAKQATELKRKEDAEKQRLAKLAANAENRGDQFKAEEFRARAENVIVLPTKQIDTLAKTITDGDISTTFVEDIEVEVTDKLAVVKAVASGRGSLDLVDINLAKVKSFLKRFPTYQIEGIKITKKIGTRTRIK